MLHEDKTKKIIQAFYTVYNGLGYGFQEKVYENALAFELRDKGFEVAQQCQITVYYNKYEVGEYFADLLVDNLIIVEIKATRHLATENEAQLLNYLKATIYEVGLLLNFGSKPELKRKLFTNDQKGHLKWIAPDHD